MSEGLTLRGAVAALRAHHGPPERPPTADPFELILWENVAYLAAPARRREAFEALRTTVGTTPAAILAADRGALEKVTEHGILKGTFAAKLRECATLAARSFGGDLDAAIRGPLETAKRALRLFPGIGEPGAEKILLFAGRHALLAPDSNALRVLTRLGFLREEPSYARMYAASRTASRSLPQDVPAMQQAHLLLQLHGRTLCKSSAPRCGECPLHPECAYARERAAEPSAPPPAARGAPGRSGRRAPRR